MNPPTNCGVNNIEGYLSSIWTKRQLSFSIGRAKKDGKRGRLASWICVFEQTQDRQHA